MIGDIIPTIFARANGSARYGGTGTPGGKVRYNTPYGVNAPVFEEYSTSPIAETGEQNTITHRFNCDYYTGQALLISLPRGTTITDPQADPTGGSGISRVLTCTLQPAQGKGNLIYDFTMVTECISFGNPPDEFTIDVVELNPAAEKHPRYNALTYTDRHQLHLADATDDPNWQQHAKDVLATIPSNPVQTLNRQGQAYELLYKKQKGEDSFYLSGYKITWSQYFWYPQYLNPGGYIEDPILAGGLPSPFWSTDGTPQGDSIFKYYTSYNQNMFPPAVTKPTLSWLRQTDTFLLNRTWFKLTRSWIGAPLGHWDNEWYNPVPQPLQVSGSQGAVPV